MIDALITFVLWLSAIGSGLMAGVYFAFSTFIMRSLATLPNTAGVPAMQSINSVILRSLFMPLFFGTTIMSLALAITALFRWDAPGAVSMLAGGITYVVGMFLCTVVFNVPLNRALNAVDPASPEANGVWSRYLTVWTRWNHVRTLACTLACGLFIASLLAASG